MVAFPLHLVTYPGYVCTSNTGNASEFKLALSKDTRVGIEEFIASAKAVSYTHLTLPTIYSV